MKLDGDFYIPTKGMDPFNIIRNQETYMSTGLYDELWATKFYRNRGQLHYSHSGPKVYAYFIQRWDGQAFVGACDGYIHFPIIKKYLDSEIRAEVILCKVEAANVSRYEQRFLNSEYGPLEFIANHHPSHEVRVRVITNLLEMVNA